MNIRLVRNHIGRILLGTMLMLVLLLLCTGMSYGETVQKGTLGDNIVWSLEDDGVLIIKGKGAVTSVGEHEYPWYAYKESIKSVLIEEGITEIGSGAFFEYKEITKVSLPWTLRIIGDSAFTGCSSLVYLHSEHSTLPGSLETIGRDAFAGCNSLTEIDLQDSRNLQEIGECAFEGCDGITEVSLPETLSTIRKRAFSMCNSLTEFTIPEKAETLGEEIVRGCDRLQTIRLRCSPLVRGEEGQYPENIIDCDGWRFRGTVYYSGIAPDYWWGIRQEDVQGRWCIEANWEWEPTEEVIVAGGDLDESIRWSLSEWGILRIEGQGAIDQHENCWNYPWNGENSFQRIQMIKISDGITEIGDCAFGMPEDPNYPGAAGVAYPNLYEVDLGDGVRRIGANAFRGEGGIHRISFPSELEAIGESAFDNCNGLTELRLPKGLRKIEKRAFANCWGLNYIEIPEGVTELGEEAFQSCWSPEVKLPDSLETIGERAFMRCQLQEIHLPENLKTIGEAAFYDCSLWRGITIDNYAHWCGLTFTGDPFRDVEDPFQRVPYTTVKLITEEDTDRVVLPEGTTAIPSGTFRGNDRLTSIELPRSLKTIGADAFSGCSGLKEVDVRSAADWCGIDFRTDLSNPLNASSDAFLQIGGGTGTKVSLPEGIKTIPDRTFAGWDMLSEITLPESIEKIGAGAFLGCKEIKTVNVASMGSWLNTKFATESSSPLAGGAQLRVKGGDTYNAVTELEIDRTVGAIPPYVFSGTDTLKTAVIPESVTQIGAGAFADCTGLSEVSLPETVTALEEKTFSGCKQLKKILIPQTITRIEYDAFSGCADDLIIYGYAGSEAESYANARGITFLPYTEYDAIRAGKLNDNIKWTLSGGTVLTIEGEGTTPDFAEGESPFAAFADQVSTVKLKGITGLGDHLLQDFTNLKRVDVSLETKLSQISASAFSGCGDVEIRCYGSCYDTVSQAIASIPELSNLTAVKRSGSRLGNVTWTYNEDTGTILLTSNGADSFGETFTESPFAELKARRVQFSDAFSCRDIPANLFKDCTTISEVQLPQQVRTIGKEAFKGCANLQTLSWYGDIAQLGEGAFCDCSSLKEIRLEGSVMMDDQGKEIKEETIEIPEQVIVIPAGCFKGCSALRQVDWYEDPEEETAAGAIDAEAFLNCSALGDISIPDHVGAIGDRAFEGCENLTDRDFSENLQEIGAKAFYGCTRMKDIRFDGDLGAIGTKAIGYYNNNNKDEVQQGLRVVAPEDASNIKTYCSANGISFITSSGIIDGDPDQKVYVKIASSVTVKKGRSKSVKYSTNGKVKKVTSSGGGGIVSVTRSGSKIKFRGLRAGNATVHLTFKMKGAGNINKTVYVKVKKSSASLGDGEAQDISVKQKSLTFESDADSPKKISVSGVQTSLLASLSKEGIAEVRVDDNGTVTVTPLRSGQTSLTLQAAEDDVFLASDKVSVGITVKARPARVTAKVKKLSKKKARVTWKKISGATAYQIQVATKKNFKGKKTYTVKAGKTATLKKTVKLKKGKKNYIRVRYLCKGKYSKWSRTLTVKK